MRTITPLHGRANIIPRADIANELHGSMGKGGEIDSAIFGKVRVGSVISYLTPAKRDSFAFGEVASMGHQAREGSGSKAPGVCDGDIVGFDLYQVGHEIDAGAYYPNASVFYTLPWKEIVCRFVGGRALPVGQWVMLEPDEVMTRRLLFASSGTTLHLPSSGPVRTNSNVKTKVRLTAGKILATGGLCLDMHGALNAVGKWALHSPIDAVTIDMGKGQLRAFVKFDDIEELVSDGE